MRALFTATLLICSLASVACKSRDPEKCPAGDRTMKATEDYAELGYPDGAVACLMGGVATPSVFYNGLDSDEAAAAKLTEFMKSKGYQGKLLPAQERDLAAAARGRTTTRLTFTKEGASVRYDASLATTTEGHAVNLGLRRYDCTVTPHTLGCQK
jgi:hypothetical protein